ncbi:glycine oxidase ThiO [Rhodococcus sp. RS1C4]|uniref:glycine oxidase ThiO n=1 Tax=Rhodococcoides fascians TaxID=1828 RepID=UPI0005622F24|nr:MULTISPECIES: glycine oxidase ThiO [Rhodococcus]OZC51877.1 glycine oxidase ThiO [Rhodococcus sp. RS1C4]OZF04698.1 glycine oxidase ThiO [Rhodococcus sp. 15-1154-1]
MKFEKSQFDGPQFEKSGLGTLAVVGGGVIGLAVAARAQRDGWSVQLYDPNIGSGASWVAGGMLAPLSEGWPGEHELLKLGARSLDRWPEFARELGVDVFTASGSLTVALDAADAQDLRTIAEFVGEHGHQLDILNRAQIRELEPSLAQNIRLGLLAPTEQAVDNRALVDALTASAAGVDFVAEQVTDLDALTADRIVVAAGAQVSALLPDIPVRPVKGEILRLRRRPSATAPPSRTIRGSVHGRPIYLVPRGDGLVVGATQYESGHDTQVTVAGVRDLIADAERLMPSIGEYELHEAAAGLRPMSPDGLPLIGRVSERVIVAAGHGRNGILLTPITTDAVAALLTGDTLPEAKAADPARFETGRHR